MGDPDSKFGSSAASAADVVAAAGATAPGSAGIGGTLAADLPTALEMTTKGLMCGSGVAADGAAGADRVHVSVADVGEARGNGGSQEGDTPKTVEKRAIQNIFRTVDLDASGHVSQEELLEVVSVAYERMSADATDF